MTSTLKQFALALLLIGIPTHVLAQTPDPVPGDQTETEDTLPEEAEIALPQPIDEPTSKPTEKPLPQQIGGRNISAFTRNLLGNTTVGGYFDTDYVFPTQGNSFFDQHHVILQVSSFIHERLFFNTEIEYEHGALLGTGTNDGQLRVEQAYLDFKFMDSLILRTGALLIPLGRLNVLHDSDFRDTTARPLFNEVIMPTTWTETGLGFYGTLYPDDFWEINYEAYVVQGLTDNLKDGGGLKAARNSLSKDNNNAKALTTRVGFSPFIGLEFGLGGYLSPFDDAGKKNLGMLVGDFNWSNGPFEVLGEGGAVFFDPTTQKIAEKEMPLNGSMWGYYLEGHYHLFPDFLKDSWLSNGFEQPVFTLFGRISQVDTDTSQLNINDRTRLTLGLNFRPITNVVFKLEYQWNIENEAILKNDPSKEIANNALVASVAAGF